MKNLKEKLVNTFLIALLASPIGIERIDTHKRMNLFTKVKHIANKDGGLVEDYEWRNVYESMGKNYDEVTSDPLYNLSLNEMREYIEANH